MHRRSSRARRPAIHHQKSTRQGLVILLVLHHPRHPLRSHPQHLLVGKRRGEKHLLAVWGERNPYHALLLAAMQSQPLGAIRRVLGQKFLLLQGTSNDLTGTTNEPIVDTLSSEAVRSVQLRLLQLQSKYWKASKMRLRTIQMLPIAQVRRMTRGVMKMRPANPPRRTPQIRPPSSLRRYQQFRSK